MRILIIIIIIIVIIKVVRVWAIKKRIKSILVESMDAHRQQQQHARQTNVCRKLMAAAVRPQQPPVNRSHCPESCWDRGKTIYFTTNNSFGPLNASSRSARNRIGSRRMLILKMKCLRFIFIRWHSFCKRQTRVIPWKSSLCSVHLDFVWIIEAGDSNILNYVGLI